MKNILVPTDFSATAENAARYALHLADQINAPKIILYNAYQAPVALDPMAMAPAVLLLDEEQLRTSSMEALEHFKEELKKDCPQNCSIELFCEYALLNNGLDHVCEKTDSDLIVMGITGGGLLEETLIGSNTIAVSKHSTKPVIIVPKDARFNKIEKVALACDFKSVIDTTPVEPIRNLLEETSAKLMVLNIDHTHQHFDPEIPFQSKMLDQLFHSYYPEYHFIDQIDFMEGVHRFVLENKIDLLITIPKKHGFFDQLFHRSHTKQMAFHVHVPLMIVHD
ncbi:MAG: universal stress protein [Bacteroidota bacterium]|nr:universal stress protein [Bacteroidota bacterium]